MREIGKCSFEMIKSDDVQQSFEIIYLFCENNKKF